METEGGKGPEGIKVENLSPNSRGIDIAVKIVSKGAVRETMGGRRVADALVGDETGCIYLTLWEDDIARVNEGETIAIKNGYVSIFRGSMRLNIGRYGSFSMAETPISEVKTDNNLSERRIEGAPRYPSFRPSYGGSGYRSGRREYRQRRR
jgi:replication factor A1